MAVAGVDGSAWAQASPPSVAHGIVRPTVLARLDERWNHAVTTVVAGAGFGKSVALGQAMRANQADPRGIEAWISCRSGCEDPVRFARSIRNALGAPAAFTGMPLRAVQDVIAGLSPVETTLLFDDVETLAAAPTCIELLDQLVRGDWPGVHIVLAGRALPRLRLTRLRAAGQILSLGEEELRFTDADVEALALSLGVEAPRRDLGGWPALVRLALTSPEAVEDFLGEEVIDALDRRDRQALVALSLLGPSEPADVAAVCGRSFDAEGFCQRVPLVHRAGGRVVSHALWDPVRDVLLPAGEVAEVARRALDVVSSRDDPVAAGVLAVRLGDQPALGRAAVALVRSTLASLPVHVADAWLAAATEVSPEMELLSCARDNASAAATPLAQRLDAVMAGFRENDDLDGEMVALALAAIVANATHDFPRLIELSARARTLTTEVATPDPIVQLLVSGIDGAAAAQAGDISGALSHLERPIEGLRPEDRPEAIVRLRWHLLLLAGRASEAAQLAEETFAAPLVVERELAAAARWLDGDPSAFEIGEVVSGADRYGSLSERDRFDQAAFVAVLAACAGEVAQIDEAVAILESAPFPALAAADAALVTVAKAARAVVYHDDAAAAGVLATFLEHNAVEGLTEALLRRSPAIGYVCSPELRDRWDAANLGPSHRRACAIARLLVDARAGRLPATVPDYLPAVCTALPLPWSMELAARAAGHGVSWGSLLGEELADRIGERVLAELDRLLESRDPSVRRGAEALRRALPTKPAGTVEIRVLGPLEVCRNGRPVDAPELRRARVRELLSILVVEHTLTRNRAIDLLWRDHHVDKARANLRVTLGHLRRLLEPDRPTGAPPYFLRADMEHIRLASVDGLEVDLWSASEAMNAAEAARQAGHAEARARELAAAVARWRGRPLPDLDRVDDLAPHAHRVASRLVDAVLHLGELELVRGGLTQAAHCAERALRAAPYHERALRLAVAAALQGRDRTAAETAVTRLHARLDELGVEPDETSAMLLRQAAAWLGP